MARNTPVTAGLARVLAGTAALAVKTQNFHWNVEGPHFAALHGLFEEQYGALQEASDTLAERIRALGDYAPGGLAAFAALSPVGDAPQGPPAAEAMIASLADSAAKAVERDIKGQARFWSGKNEKEQKEASTRAVAWASRHTGHRVDCPACSSPALLQGNPSGTVTTDVNGDDVVQRQSMLPSMFECIACELRIVGFSKLSACGLGNSFKVTSTYSAAEFFDLYTEDDLEEARGELPTYEDDFNE